MSDNQNSNEKIDARPLSVAEVLEALHTKFSDNFETCKSVLFEAEQAEEKARIISAMSARLHTMAGENAHQRQLAMYVDEIFGDSICAIYLASCGLHVPAQMLLRRSLELGLVIAAYWDSPADFWQWREHDGDIRFAALSTTLSSAGYITFLNKLPRAQPVEASLFAGLQSLYSDLSNVVHPKPYNFATTTSNYSFSATNFTRTMNLSKRTYTYISEIIKARFPQL